MFGRDYRVRQLLRIGPGLNMLADMKKSQNPVLTTSAHQRSCHHSNRPWMTLHPYKYRSRWRHADFGRFTSGHADMVCNGITGRDAACARSSLGKTQRQQ